MIRIRDIQNFKKKGEKFATVTVYDYSSAILADRVGFPLLLVGDSAAMVIYGYKDTNPVSMDEMVFLTKAARRGTRNAFLVADMPFMSYQISVEDALRNAGRFVQEGGASAVKLEGGERMLPQVKAIISVGIPVMGHVGLTPQSHHQFSGYRVQGKDSDSALQIVADCDALETAGVFTIVLEGVPSDLAKSISERMSVPTIGIAAGPHCDGQIQVFHDILGYYEDFSPKHSKKFVNLSQFVSSGLQDYKEQVERQEFPGSEHCTKMKSEHLQEFLRRMQ